MKKLMIILTLIVAPLMGANTGFGQEEISFEMEEDQEEFTYGNLVSMKSDQIVILEFDFDADEDLEVSYAINGETDLDGVNRLDEFEIGEEMEVLYITNEGSRVATLIARSAEEEETFKFEEELEVFDDELEENSEKEMEALYRE